MTRTNPISAFAPAASVSKAATWLTRFLLGAATLLFLSIAFKYAVFPVQSSAEIGILLNSPLGITIARVGMGGFPLVFSLIFLICLISPRRNLAGLYALAIVDGTLLAVRTAGAAVDGSIVQNVRLFVPEIVLLVLTTTAIALQLRDRLRWDVRP